MHITINIPTNEIRSAITLGEEPNTISFMKYYIGNASHMSGIAKAKLLLGMSTTVSRTFTSGDVSLDMDIVVSKSAVVITLHTDLTKIHNAARIVYGDPEGFKRLVVEALIDNKKPMIKGIKNLRKDLKVLAKAITNFTPEMANDAETTTAPTTK